VGATRVPGEAGGLVPPGTVLGVGNSDGLPVQTGRGVLRLLTLQRPGGRMLSAEEFLRGFDLPSGAQLKSAEMPPLVRGKIVDQKSRD
jgi:methionyl-tRNA formyltransferase